jgi:UrcA family protein
MRFQGADVRFIVAPSTGSSAQHTQPETNLNNCSALCNAKASICIAAMAACALLSGIVQAKEEIVTVKMTVSTAGLDAGQPAGARALYARLWSAATIVCGRANRVGRRGVDNFSGCVETAIGGAVRSVNLPQLTLVYLSTHSLQDASNQGISVPVLVAAK